MTPLLNKGIVTHPPLVRDLSDADQGALLLAHHRGKMIEFYSTRLQWCLASNPSWFEKKAYRIAATPDTIDWSHLAPEWRFVARDKNGLAWAYINKPDLKSAAWCAKGEYGSRVTTPSFRNNGMPWDQSLIERPENE